MADAYSTDDDQSEPTPERPRDARPWLDLIKEAEDCYQTWQEKCDNVDKQYADLERLSDTVKDREFQIFWANLEVLKPSIYARPPVPVVVPRFKDRKELPRRASEMLERTLNTSFDFEDIDAVMRQIRDDVAVSSRGAVWLRYEASETADGLTEKVCYDHVDRRDFLILPADARKWSEVEGVARRSWLTRKKGLARFGDMFLEAEFREREGEDEATYKTRQKAPVWEIWSKAESVVVWVSPGMDEVLDIQEPWLDLANFFPCPRPAYGTLRRGSLIPVPDFLYYKDQVEEINEITARISALTERLRMKGFYPGGAEDVGKAIEAVLNDLDNRATLVAIPNFGALGGQTLKDSIVWLPVKEVADTIVALITLRKELISDVYQITGLSDIMRGTSEKDETATAQQIKAQYGSVRIRDRQSELVRIARDMTRLAGEIMAENFSPETLMQMSQVDMPSEADIAAQVQQIEQQVTQLASQPQVQQMAAQNPQAAQQALGAAQAEIAKLQQVPTVEKVVQLFRDQRTRPFVLDIETDSTIQPDEDAAKQRAAEFITAVGGFMQQTMPVVAAAPEAAPLAAEMLKYVASQFRAGRELDGVIDDFAEKVKERAGQPQPNPEAEKAQAEAQAKEKEFELKSAELAMKRETSAAELEMKRESGAAELGLKREMAAADFELKREMEGKKIEAGAKPTTTIKLDAQDAMMVVAESVRQIADAASEAVKTNAEATTNMAAEMAVASQHIAAAVQQMNAPKRLIRDRAGRPVGVETVN